MKKTLSFKSCIIVFYLLVFIAFIIEKRPILSNSTPYFSRIANATNLVPFYYDPNSNGRVKSLWKTWWMTDFRARWTMRYHSCGIKIEYFEFF